MSFWYHIPFEQVDRMPLAAINAYMGALPGLMAELRVQMMDATMLPHMKDTARRRALDEAHQLAYGDDDAATVVTAKPQALARMGIGVRFVRNDGKSG